MSVNFAQSQMMAQLGGVKCVIHFDDADAMVAAALVLMHCHPHHFAVLPDSRFGLAVSADAASCLQGRPGMIP